MVVRKASIPYPSSPPPPPPPLEASIPPSHHQIDSTDLPPVPQAASRANGTSSFEEMGNPWQDDYSPRQPPETEAGPATHVPDSLKPGFNRAPAPSDQLPDVLRPGWSGEATPRSSLDSDRDRSPEREWWDDDDVVEEDPADETPARPLHVVNTPHSPQPSSAVKRKPLPSSHSPQSAQKELASNNPYRRPSETFLHPPAAAPPETAREDHPHPLRSAPSIDRLGELNLNEPAEDKEEKIAVTEPPLTPPPPPPPPPQQAPPPLPHLQPPLIPSQPQPDHDANPWTTQQRLSPVPSMSSFDPAKQTVSTDDLLDRGSLNEHHGAVSLGDELRAIPNAAHIPQPSIGPDELSLLDDEPAPPKPPRPSRQDFAQDYAPPTGPPPSHLPPTKPPRPAVLASQADLVRLKEQRNETYQIKHFNWYDPRTSNMRRSSMLTQNENGPCPLLALVNALILGATADMQAALDDALRSREQVSLGLIIETLMDELISKASLMPDLQLPEIDELNRFLMRLRTGMNANPRFVPQRSDAPNLIDADSPTTPTTAQPQTIAGTFETTQDIKLYSSFKVKLVHGWLPRPDDEAAEAFARSAQTYEDAQAVQFGEEELEYKLSSAGLTEQEQRMWEDITSIKQFFQAYPTQLTPYGLGALQQTLQPGEFAILFRNDHFSTIHKHPHDQRLYTLITDAGYADRDEIIWESLEDINGARSDFFSGDFSSVNHSDAQHSMPHSATAAANPRRTPANQTFHLPEESYQAAQSLTAQEQQEQHDADFAMALQLQEEEEQRIRRARIARERTGGAGLRPSPPSRPHTSGRRSQGNIPIPLRSNPGGEIRPIIPPRNLTAPPRDQAVSRPADADSADAPPTYEVAARQTPYEPPLGSPLHPSSSSASDLPLPTGMGRASTSTSSVHAQGQTSGYMGAQGRGQRPGMGYIPSHGGAGTAHRRRTSAYIENTSAAGYDHSPDYSPGPMGPAYAHMTPTGPDSRRRMGSQGGERDRDCVVM